jgi:RNA polymerase sigma-70 factor (ECF subfamily)
LSSIRPVPKLAGAAGVFLFTRPFVMFAVLASSRFLPQREPLVLRDRTLAVADERNRKADPASSALDAAMDRYARGEDAAFEELYDGLAPRLQSFLLRYTRDQARAEDVVQQTMLQIHRARGRFTPGAQVVPWAFAIARRLLIDMHRRGGREVLAPTGDDNLTQLMAALDAPADDVAIAKEIAGRLSEELARLPENQRVAFELIKQDGLSVAEAAQVLGTTVAAVKLRAHRAYEAMRAVLARLAVEDEKKGGRA